MSQRMPIPDFQSIILPLIESLANRQETNMRELTDHLAERFALTSEQRAKRLPSGQQSIFSNRVAWSKSHLKAAGLLESPTRGKVRITALGLKALEQRPPTINVRFLKQYPAYCASIGKSQPQEAPSSPPRLSD
jgi:restriction system protein